MIDQQGQVLVENIKRKIAAVDRMNEAQLSSLSPQKEEQGSLLDQLLGADSNKNTETLLPKDVDLNERREKRIEDIW